jgi:hypothetical protein
MDRAHEAIRNDVDLDRHDERLPSDDGPNLLIRPEACMEVLGEIRGECVTLT